MNGSVLDWRGLSASIASVVAMVGLAISMGHDWYLLGLAFALLLAAAVTIHVPALGPQILGRAVWWANLGLGVVITILASGHEGTGGLALALGCGTALLLAGRQRLSAATAAAGYAPSALRGMLLLLMIFALADAQTFLVFGSIDLVEGRARYDLPAALLPIGLAYVAGFIGLYKLRLWGALVNIATSFVVLLVVNSVLIDQIDNLRWFFTALAVVHIATATPVTIAALRGKELVSLSPWSRQAVTVVVTAGLMLLSLGSWASRR